MTIKLESDSKAKSCLLFRRSQGRGRPLVKEGWAFPDLSGPPLQIGDQGQPGRQKQATCVSLLSLPPTLSIHSQKLGAADRRLSEEGRVLGDENACISRASALQEGSKNFPRPLLQVMPSRLLGSDCCRRAFVNGAFWSCPRLQAQNIPSRPITVDVWSSPLQSRGCGRRMKCGPGPATSACPSANSIHWDSRALACGKV